MNTVHIKIFKRVSKFDDIVMIVVQRQYVVLMHARMLLLHLKRKFTNLSNSGFFLSIRTDSRRLPGSILPPE